MPGISFRLPSISAMRSIETVLAGAPFVEGFEIDEELRLFSALVVRAVLRGGRAGSGIRRPRGFVRAMSFLMARREPAALESEQGSAAGWKVTY